MLNYCDRIKKVADIKASQFFPRPKVDFQGAGYKPSPLGGNVFSIF
jgi:hypothetical protein